MNEQCTAEPISFLRLDRYLLQEASASERELLEAHLRTCPACQSSLQTLRQQHGEVTLLPLPLARARTRRPTWPFLASGMALAAAAAGLLVVRSKDPEQRAQETRVKGAALAIDLVREHQGDIAWEPTTFAPGDRFEVRLSCPPPQAPHWDLVVFQGSEQFFPLTPSETVPCGNHITLPGAFSLTGQEDARVCVVLDLHAAIDRERLASSLPSTHACLVLKAAVSK